MLRTLRLHRLVAGFFTAFAFWASSVEVMLPELHDGDGEAEVATTVASNSTTAVAHVDATSSQREQPAPDDAPLSHHGFHVDHCGHSHGAAVSCASRSPLATPHDAVPQAKATTLASVELPPHLRPPIL